MPEEPVQIETELAELVAAYSVVEVAQEILQQIDNIPFGNN